MRPIHASTKCKYSLGHLSLHYNNNDRTHVHFAPKKNEEYRRTRITHIFVRYQAQPERRSKEIDVVFRKLFICNGHFDSPFANQKWARCARFAHESHVWWDLKQ